MQTDEQKEAIEYLELHADDLHEPTEEMQRSIWIALGYILDLEVKLNERADLAADIPTIQHNTELPQYDPVYVQTLKQAHDELERLLQTAEDIISKQQWQPVANGEIKCVCTETDCGTVLTVDSVGSHITISRDNDELLMWLPDDIRLCRKVQP